MEHGVIVGIPIYNEETSLPDLLDSLLADPKILRIFAVDDGSTDRSRDIIADYAGLDARVVSLSTSGHAGQIAGWLAAARSAEDGTIVFIDADALPMPGAVACLAAAITEKGAVAASGRVIASGGSERIARSRFSDELLHRVRAFGYAKEALIGRFFAVDVSWFIKTIDRVDVIANDSYLSCRARRAGERVLYVPGAVCRYVAATTADDAAAQRQRADAGYAQLREMGLLRSEDEPSCVDYGLAFVRAALWDPIGALAWVRALWYAKRNQVYRVRSHAGTWETQSSTKRRLLP